MCFLTLKYALTALHVSRNEPRNLKEALKNLSWAEAMHNELQALLTVVHVPRTSEMNVVRSKWVYTTKLKSNSSIERFKARLVAQSTLFSNFWT